MDITQTYYSMLSETHDEFNTDFQAFKDRWDKIGVEHNIFHRNGYINLDTIIVPKHVQRTGIGTAYLNELTNLADKHEKILHLTPSTDWGASKTRLNNFYKRAGFVSNMGRNKDYRITSTMIRTPKTFVGDVQKRDITIEPEKKITLTQVSDTTISKHMKDDDFKKWFGGSRVTNVFGDPIVAYHGTPDVSRIRESGFNDSEHGIFFTNDPKTAKSYHKKYSSSDIAKPGTIMAHLKIDNPLIYDHGGKEWWGTQDVIKKAKESGYDGVIINNVVDHYTTNKTKDLRPAKVFVVFKKDQIYKLD